MAIFDGFLFFLPLTLLIVVLATWKGQPFYDVFRLPYYWYRVNKTGLKPLNPVRISYGKHKAQHLIYVAPEVKTSSPRPAILFIHGGGWQFGNPEMFKAHAVVLAKAGYPVYLIGHRKLPFYSAKQLLADIESAYDTCLKDIPQRFNGKQKIIIGGMSSGGNLAALLFSKKLAIHAGFFLGAPLDLREMRLSPHVRLFAGRPGGAYYDKANPIKQLNPTDDRPVLIVQGFNDSMVSPKAALSFFQKRHSMSPLNTTLILWPKGNHFKPVSWVYDSGLVRKDLFQWLAQF